MKSPSINFAFLGSHDAQLVRLGGLAERYFKDDPNTCLIIWTLKPKNVGWERPQRYRALLADISNVPTNEMHTAKAAIRAAIRMDYGGRQRTYSPLPWLEEFTNMVYLETVHVMIASPFMLVRGFGRAKAILFWLTTLSAILNAQWFIWIFSEDRTELRAGYYLWCVSFFLLAFGFYLEQRKSSKVSAWGHKAARD